GSRRPARSRAAPATACARTGPAPAACRRARRWGAASLRAAACASAAAERAGTGSVRAARAPSRWTRASAGRRLRPALRRSAAAAPSPAGTARTAPPPAGLRPPARSLARRILAAAAEEFADRDPDPDHAHQQQLPELGDGHADRGDPALLRRDRGGATGDQRGQSDLGHVVARPELALAFAGDVGIARHQALAVRDRG